jgi:hypothetical protein
MRPIQITRAAAAAAILALVAVPAAAQSSSVQAPGAYSSSRMASRGPDQRMIDRAMREFGFDPSSLRRDQQRAIDEAWRQLLPDASPGHALNPAQATAIVYLALVHGRQGRGGWNGGWNGQGDDDGYGRGGGYGRGSDDGYGRGGSAGRGGDDGYGRGGDDGYGRGSAQCVDLNRRVYDVENAVNGDTRSMFLNDEQKRDARDAAREAQRIAVDRGWRRVADRASDVIAAVGDNLPSRSDVNARVQALKSAAGESCGQDDSRRWPR